MLWGGVVGNDGGIGCGATICQKRRRGGLRWDTLTYCHPNFAPIRGLGAVLIRLIHKVGTRLRRINYLAGHMKFTSPSPFARGMEQIGPFRVVPGYADDA